MIERHQTLFYPHSFGQFYTACTQVLGFKGGRHEGKITGLAGYGKNDPELVRLIEGTIKSDDDGFRLDKRYYAEGFPRIKFSDIAKARQAQPLLTIAYATTSPRSIAPRRLSARERGLDVPDAAERELVKLVRLVPANRP